MKRQKISSLLLDAWASQETKGCLAGACFAGGKKVCMIMIYICIRSSKVRSKIYSLPPYKATSTKKNWDTYYSTASCDCFCNRGQTYFQYFCFLTDSKQTHSTCHHILSQFPQNHSYFRANRPITMTLCLNVCRFEQNSAFTWNESSFLCLFARARRGLRCSLLNVHDTSTSF